MIILKIAFRNIFRQKRRTVFTSITILIGFSLAAFSIGWADGSYNNIINMFTRNWLGHIQIHYDDYLDNPSLYKTIENYKQIGKKLENIKGVEVWTPRVFSGGLASAGNKSSGVQIIGIEPNMENNTTKFSKKIIKGNFFSSNGSKEILLGKGAAKALNIKLSDQVVLISQAADGSIANDLFKFVGIVNTDNDLYDRSSLYLTLKDAQEFLVLEGKIHEIAIVTKKLNNVRNIAKIISKEITNKDLDVAPWQIFAKSFYRAMKADKGGMWISLFVITLVVAVGVLNTVLMSVLERTREFGVLKAIGTRPKQIIKLILYEINIITLISIVFGSIIALLANYYLSIHGIHLSQSFTYGGMKFSEMLTEINARSFYIPAITVFFTASFVGIFPAIKAAKTNPVKSLRFH
jgi:ABC-type lipoprotein release transport system permease subunit